MARFFARGERISRFDGTIDSMKIGISGARGSFSEEAALQYCEKNRIEAPAFEYLVFVEQVLEALEKGNIDIGIFAIENSNGGVVLEYLPAIGAHRFAVEEIFEVPVRHMLLAISGTKREDITAITSQKQALQQCRMYLKREWPTAEVIEYVDTATAAKDLHEGTLSPMTAVIASEGAGKLYGLETLEAGVQDLKFNYTTFIAAKALA